MNDAVNGWSSWLRIADEHILFPESTPMAPVSVLDDTSRPVPERQAGEVTGSELESGASDWPSESVFNQAMVNW